MEKKVKDKKKHKKCPIQGKKTQKIILNCFDTFVIIFCSTLEIKRKDKCEIIVHSQKLFWWFNDDDDTEGSNKIS